MPSFVLSFDWQFVLSFVFNIVVFLLFWNIFLFIIYFRLFKIDKKYNDNEKPNSFSNKRKKSWKSSTVNNKNRNDSNENTNWTFNIRAMRGKNKHQSELCCRPLEYRSIRRQTFAVCLSKQKQLPLKCKRKLREFWENLMNWWSPNGIVFELKPKWLVSCWIWCWSVVGIIAQNWTQTKPRNLDRKSRRRKCFLKSCTIFRAFYSLLMCCCSSHTITWMH